MAAYRRSDRPTSGYVIAPTLPAPWYRVGPWQTGLRSKRDAEQVEAWVQQMARMRPACVDALVSGAVKLMDAWVAHQRGTLDELLAGIGDPTLEKAVEAYRPLCSDERERSGLDQLLLYANPKARLSTIGGSAISTIYGKALEKRKPNSVYRSLHRAVRGVLAYHLSPEAVTERLRNVKVPGAQDRRDVRLTADEIRGLIHKAPNHRFGWMIALAILTTADRGPLLKLTPRHYRDGRLTIPDTKAQDRWRVLNLSRPADTVLRLATAGLGADERLFPWTDWQARKLWDGTREAAGLPWLRFKDLRHLLPSTLAEMGVDRREIQAILGHAAGSRQTDRYITPAGDVTRLDLAAELLGLREVHLRAEGA